jgi:hypothetical protein
MAWDPRPQRPGATSQDARGCDDEARGVTSPSAGVDSAPIVAVARQPIPQYGLNYGQHGRHGKGEPTARCQTSVRIAAAATT